jgi:hypothetical protein
MDKALAGQVSNPAIPITNVEACMDDHSSHKDVDS